MTSNPYHLDLRGAQFVRLCGGNQDEEEQESCVEIAPVPNGPGLFAIRDSKNTGAGTLVFSGEELSTFASAVGGMI